MHVWESMFGCWTGYVCLCMSRNFAANRPHSCIYFLLTQITINIILREKKNNSIRREWGTHSPHQKVKAHTNDMRIAFATPTSNGTCLRRHLTEIDATTVDAPDTVQFSYIWNWRTYIWIIEMILRCSSNASSDFDSDRTGWDSVWCEFHMQMIFQNKFKSNWIVFFRDRQTSVDGRYVSFVRSLATVSHLRRMACWRHLRSLTTSVYMKNEEKQNKIVSNFGLHIWIHLALCVNSNCQLFYMQKCMSK